MLAVPAAWRNPQGGHSKLKLQVPQEKDKKNTIVTDLCPHPARPGASLQERPGGLFHARNTGVCHAQTGHRPCSVTVTRDLVGAREARAGLPRRPLYKRREARALKVRTTSLRTSR